MICKYTIRKKLRNTPRATYCRLTNDFCVGSEIESEPMGDYEFYDYSVAERCPLNHYSLDEIFQKSKCMKGDNE